MKIIITSGGTSENIDKVRKITNNSSGRLGSMIANEFIKNGNKIEKIYYICDKKAVLPVKNNKIDIIYISNVESLNNKLQSILKTEKVDIVVHSMAVSDYTVDYVTTCESLANKLQNKTNVEINDVLSNGCLDKSSEGKISSNCSNLIIKLKQTPKVISNIKKWSSVSTLVGFKLLVDSSYENLIEVAKTLMENNNCDYVLANDLSSINKTLHKGYLLSKNGNVACAKNKQAIAKLIVKELLCKN